MPAITDDENAKGNRTRFANTWAAWADATRRKLSCNSSLPLPPAPCGALDRADPLLR